jgi:hypothetical protein
MSRLNLALERDVPPSGQEPPVERRPEEVNDMDFVLDQLELLPAEAENTAVEYCPADTCTDLTTTMTETLAHTVQ